MDVNLNNLEILICHGSNRVVLGGRAKTGLLFILRGEQNAPGAGSMRLFCA
jgi:hypothetical protein